MGWRIAVRGVLIASLLSVAASAQIRMPASATSMGSRAFRGGFGGGLPINTAVPPASVLSFRPAFQQPVAPFRNFHHGAQFRHGGHYPSLYGGYGYAYAVPVYVAPDTEYADYVQPQARPVDDPPREPQKLEITIVDRRAEKDDAPAEEKVAKAERAPAPIHSEPTVAEVEPTLIVFKDGTKKELRNYAIMGKDLFDLADNKMFRIPLDAVNVDATVAANAANGKQFRLP